MDLIEVSHQDTSVCEQLLSNRHNHRSMQNINTMQKQPNHDLPKIPLLETTSEIRLEKPGFES